MNVASKELSSRGKWLSKPENRAKNSNWTKNSNDRNEFGGNREAAILRDKEKCVKCGITRSQHRITYGKDITVDHIDGKGKLVSKEDKNNELSNLQTLCSKCHGAKDGKLAWSKRAPRTHCKNGHELTPENVYTSPSNTHRRCKTCRTTVNKVHTKARAAARQRLAELLKGETK